MMMIGDTFYDPEVAQQLDSRMLSERQIERDAVVSRFLQELHGVVERCRFRRHVTRLGCDPADDHAVEMIVVDDEEVSGKRVLGHDGGPLVRKLKLELFEHLVPTDVSYSPECKR
jgi:hypothetical protein